MIKEALLPEFDHETATTRRLLERIPDERLSWKPHAKSMSLGSLGTHLANLPLWADTILNRSMFDLAEITQDVEKTATADILAAFDRAARAARGWMDRTDQEYLALWSLKRSGQEMFTLPRIAALRTFVLSHMIHHRGQLSVYLRLNDVAVPAIYGPTADEG
jgi:uncharacterized damage-inducible protein DinB